MEDINGLFKIKLIKSMFFSCTEKPETVFDNYTNKFNNCINIKNIFSVKWILIPYVNGYKKLKIVIILSL